jgi:hypothetical protein
LLKSITDINSVLNIPEVLSYRFDLNPGDVIPKIRTGVDRYGYFILKAENREKLLDLKGEIFNSINVDVI